MQHDSTLIRSRWAAVGAAVAICLGAGGVGFGIVNATVDSGERAIVTPIAPCRLIDTRPEHAVGPRTSPLGPAETITLDAHGANGDCNIPPGATGLSLNVTAVDATAPTYLTVYPNGAPMPNASSLNPVPGGSPVPNAVITDIDGDGRFNVFNLAGSVHLIVDVNGYLEHHSHDDRYYTESESDDRYAIETQTYFAPGFDPSDLTTVAPRGGTLIQQTTQFSIKTNKSGRLHLSRNLTADLTCTTSTEPRSFFLVLDDVIVPGTAVTVNATDRFTMRLSGVTDDAVPAGDHLVKVGFSCTNSWTAVNFVSGSTLTVQVFAT